MVRFSLFEMLTAETFSSPPESLNTGTGFRQIRQRTLSQRRMATTFKFFFFHSEKKGLRRCLQQALNSYSVNSEVDSGDFQSRPVTVY